MRKGILKTFAVAFVLGAVAAGPVLADDDDRGRDKRDGAMNVQLGPRPFYLMDKMNDSRLKKELEQCAQSNKPFKKTDFSIGHRGAALQFPEHTKESYTAAARMGAGIMECDVTFTKDKELVCRHAQCDLHTTTDILLNPANADLAAKCGTSLTPNNPARCCTSDLTLAEFKRLKGKMDAPGATANWRTDLYATGGTLMTHKESIQLFKKLGVGMTPELKSADVAMPFEGFTQEDYAQKMIDEYKQARISPKSVWPQSFNLNDVLYWISNEPQFGKQGVFLEARDAQINPADPSDDALSPNMQELADMGVKVVAPPMWYLLTVKNGKMVPSRYAVAARKAGLQIISWTTERSGRIVEEVLKGSGNYYYQSTDGSAPGAENALSSDGDILTTIHVLAKDVRIIGLFSDWPATTTFYANCMNVK